MPAYRDFLTHPAWVQDVYWSVIRKALLAIALGLTGLVGGYYRLRDGDAIGAGLCWVGLSLLGSRVLKPTEAEFEFIGRYNRFLSYPPNVTMGGAASGAPPGAGVRVIGEQ